MDLLGRRCDILPVLLGGFAFFEAMILVDSCFVIYPLRFSSCILLMAFGIPFPLLSLL